MMIEDRLEIKIVEEKAYNREKELDDFLEREVLEKLRVFEHMTFDRERKKNIELTISVHLIAIAKEVK